MIADLAQTLIAAAPSTTGSGVFLAIFINLLASAIFIALACLWAFQFAQLMLLRDNDFPGRFDKALWVIAFVLLAPITMFAFILWKRAALAIGAKKKSAEGRVDVLKAIGQALGTADDPDDADDTDDAASTATPTSNQEKAAAATANSKTKSEKTA